MSKESFERGYADALSRLVKQAQVSAAELAAIRNAEARAARAKNPVTIGWTPPRGTDPTRARNIAQDFTASTRDGNLVNGGSRMVVNGGRKPGVKVMKPKTVAPSTTAAPAATTPAPAAAGTTVAPVQAPAPGTARTQPLVSSPYGLKAAEWLAARKSKKA